MSTTPRPADIDATPKATTDVNRDDRRNEAVMTVPHFRVFTVELGVGQAAGYRLEGMPFVASASA